MDRHHPSLPRERRIRAAILSLVLAASAGWLVTGCSPGGGSGGPGAAGAAPDDRLATMGGEAITRAEVEAAAADALEEIEERLLQARTKADQDRHDVLEGQTRQLVRERILRAEAEARGLTESELLEAEVESRVPEVTPEDVEAFFEQNRDRLGQATKEQVAARIESYLAQQRRSEVYEEFISGLEEKYDVSYEIGPHRVTVETAGEPSAGPADAPVTIVEFSDFECPYCSRLVPTLDRVKEEYGDRVRLVFKQFPLRSIHPNAQKAAEASLCAHDQGRFWEMHDAMFADQRNLGVEALEGKAQRIGLDRQAFSECLDSGRYADDVEEDLREGMRLGVSGTPAMFINGRLLSGAVPYEEVVRVLDEELAGS